jgi:hypothetical protein
VKGEPSDISPFDEYVWYEWGKFSVTSFNFPDSKIGDAIYIGPEMARKVPKKGKLCTIHP